MKTVNAVGIVENGRINAPCPNVQPGKYRVVIVLEDDAIKDEIFEDKRIFAET